MKTNRICKSTVSLILALIMLVSMCTVAFVNVSAAEADTAQTGAAITGGTTLYLNPTSEWDKDGARFAAYFCNGSSPAHWYSAYGPNSDGYYWVTVVAGESHNNVVWCRMNGSNTTNDWSTRWNQTIDLTWDGSKSLFTVTDPYPNGSNAKGTWSSYTPAGSVTEAPTTAPTEKPTTTTDPDDPAEVIEISFLINSDTKWVSSDDAKMFIKSGSDIIEMDETVDTKSGHVMWTAEVAAHSSYTFYRTSYFFDESNASTKAWNSWTASSRGSNTVFKATSDTGGSWAAASTVNAADPKDIANFWDDLWIDTRGEGNPEHAVKVYYTGSSFHLYVPSYVNLSNVTVYSDHEKVVIGGTEYASGTKANLTTGEHTFAFKDGSTTTNKGTLKIYQTVSTAAMLMTTKEELYTGTTAGLASDNAWPSDSGITSNNYNGVYKDAIETKGSYYFYDEEGNIVNSDPVLKKIKGRGNSSFEASMRLYGKYAYNFNLDQKVALIDGSTASKKWCLLANNVDHTMMRNTFIYALADDIGIKYAPETRLLDLYDNGKYLGAYVITEKVEYGKNTLMKDMKNLDDGNEDANIEAYANEDIMDDLEGHLVQAESSVTVNGQKYTYQYTKSDDTTNWPYHQPADYQSYNYLLEFELYNRYKNEASWFVSPRTGQAVVVKYPEFATQDEMEWIISEYEAAEAAIYANNTAEIQNTVDVDSFAKMYLLQELSMNLDSCATSYYIHNDLSSGKLVSSPVWDYDWAFGAYAGNTKFIYNGSSVVNSVNMSSPNTQMFVKNKALKTDSGDNTKKSNYNFQAKLVHNDYVWERCQYIWTNQMVDALNDYIINESITNDTKGIIEDEWLGKFQSSVEMNDARWGSLSFTGDDWGTKVTSNYNNRSYNFYIGDTSKSGTATKSYANTVYYLNDWVATRWNYMSSSTGGALYNASLVDPYDLKSVTLNATQNGADVTVSVTFDATYNGTQIENQYKAYDLYVNGSLYKEACAITENSVVTLVPNEETSIHAVAYLTGDKDAYNMTSATKKFTYEVTGPEYKVENVTFTAVQSDDESKVTITPSATVTADGVELSDSEKQYTIYLNGTAVAGPTTFETASTTINLTNGRVNEVYVMVTAVDKTNVSATSITQKFSYGVEVEKVNVTIKFKSSESYRYLPTVQIGDNNLPLTKGATIGKNASYTQSYAWFTLTTQIDKGVATKITFKNAYSMSATTTVNISEDAEYYFAVDNLNDGSVVEDLTKYNTTDEHDQLILNFKLSASHMVYNDDSDPELATTSINGKMLKVGDANEDNKFNISDATTMQRSLAELDTLTATGSALADFNLDGVNSIMDVTNAQTKLTV